ncbi:MAG: hypothetical protein AB8B73_15900, partial [Ekhidna sp.]
MTVQNESCDVYEVNYDSLDNYIKRVVKYAKKNKLDYPKNLNYGQLKKLFLKDTISKKKQTTKSLHKDFSEKTYGMIKDDDYSDITPKDNYSQSFPAHPSIEYIPLKFIQYQDNNGDYPATETQILEAIDVVNENFRRHFMKIRFYMSCSVTYSSCVSCGNSPNNLEKSIMYLNNANSAINIHMLHSGKNTGTYPFTTLPFNITLNEDGLTNRTTFTHELGHTLGLYHTHRGRDFWQSTPLFGFFFSEIDNHSSKKCYQESASRTRTQATGCLGTSTTDKKCDVNGEELCDTPASPKLNNTRFNSLNCEFTWTEKDNWGDSYNPQVNNYMGYGNNCRSFFTFGQRSRMESYIPSYSSTSNTYSISYTTQSG